MISVPARLEGNTLSMIEFCTKELAPPAYVTGIGLHSASSSTSSCCNTQINGIKSVHHTTMTDSIESKMWHLNAAALALDVDSVHQELVAVLGELVEQAFAVFKRNKQYNAKSPVQTKHHHIEYIAIAVQHSLNRSGRELLPPVRHDVELAVIGALAAAQVQHLPRKNNSTDLATHNREYRQHTSCCLRDAPCRRGP